MEHRQFAPASFEPAAANSDTLTTDPAIKSFGIRIRDHPHARKSGSLHSRGGAFKQRPTHSSAHRARRDPQMVDFGKISPRSHGAKADCRGAIHRDHHPATLQIARREGQLRPPGLEPPFRIAPVRFGQLGEFAQFPRLMGSRANDSDPAFHWSSGSFSRENFTRPASRRSVNSEDFRSNTTTVPPLPPPLTRAP